MVQKRKKIKIFFFLFQSKFFKTIKRDKYNILFLHVQKKIKLFCLLENIVHTIEIKSILIYVTSNLLMVESEYKF